MPVRTRSALRLVALCCSVATVATPAASQATAAAPVVYDIRFPNLVHHEAEVSVRFSGVPDGPLRVRMDRGSPGRYALAAPG